jgi:ribonuclease R
LQTMLLRSMQQAVYTPDNIGHFGLAFEAYCHFTSPIRRYPDLLTHRAIKAILHGKRYEPKGIPQSALNTTVSNAARKQQAKDKIAGTQKREQDQTIWDALGVHCSANERRADEASRDVENWLKCYFIRDKLGEAFTGTISAVTSFGIFVQLDALYIEGLVHITELGGDYFQYDEIRHELRGERTGRRFQLTDRLTVQVSRVDLEARKIDLSLVELGNAKVGVKPLPMVGTKESTTKGSTTKGPTTKGSTTQGTAKAPADASSNMPIRAGAKFGAKSGAEGQTERAKTGKRHVAKAGKSAKPKTAASGLSRKKRK